MLLDLELPSGNLWCKYNFDSNVLDYNIKISTPKDWYGSYYAYGELETKKKYSDNNYKFICDNIITKYNNTDKLFELEKCDDIVSICTDGHLHIPSRKDFEELKEYTEFRWEENYQYVIGLNGELFTSKFNGVELFFPAGGVFGRNEIVDAGKSAIYQCSTNTLSQSIEFFANKQSVCLYNHLRFVGLPIRAIKRKI